MGRGQAVISADAGMPPTAVAAHAIRTSDFRIGKPWRESGAGLTAAIPRYLRNQRLGRRFDVRL